jgi:3-oxoacyl-[acyl-carrier-protein] synthase-1
VSDKKRVVVTGLGIISCIGNEAATVTESLRQGRCGIQHDPDMAEYGFRSQVSGRPADTTEMAKEIIGKRSLRFMGDASIWSALAMDQAIKQSGLDESQISHPRTGIIAGSGGPSVPTIIRAADITRKNNSPKRIGPFAVPKAMSSTVSATLATHFKIKGVNFSISSACTTSLHCIGASVEQIQWGKQDVMFAGGGEELTWMLSNTFDAMGAMSSLYNDTPDKASRPFDANRDGFVIAGGAAMLVLESYEHATARGAEIIAEVLGYGATSDGYDMVAPSGEGAKRAMTLALADAGLDTVDYINPHMTSTPVGDIAESRAIHELFGEGGPAVSATKALTGHSLGGAGAQEAVYSLLMMQNGFIAPSVNIETLDPDVAPINIARELREQEVKTAMSNSFGFGGTNGSVVFGAV